VTIVSAQGLPKMDTFGKVDAFVHWSGGKTPVISKNFNPVWNYRGGGQVLEPGGDMRFSVYDHDSSSADDIIGHAVVSFDEIMRQAASQGSPLEQAPHNAKVSGISTAIQGAGKRAGKDNGRLTIMVEVHLKALDVARKQAARAVKEAKKAARAKYAMDFFGPHGLPKLGMMFAEVKMNQLFFEDLVTLKNFDIILVLDDSGSMNSRVEGGITRWDELKQVTKIVVELAGAVDQNGCDIYFLNRQGRENVTDWNTAQSLFSKGPGGGTPLTEACTKALHGVESRPKPVLLIIATDGVPNNLRSFTDLLAHRNADKIFISILACSDNDAEIGYLNRLDKEVRNLDVLDDYKSEKKEVKKKQGPKTKYSLGDHVARLLLGPIYPRYDRIDELKLHDLSLS